MQLTYHCPACGHCTRTGDLQSVEALRCAQCGWEQSAPKIGASLSKCAVCGNPDLWRQKDFPQGLGLALVAAGALLSSVAWYFHWPKAALGLLMAFALADMLVFAVMPDVLVCYRCKARHRRPETADADVHAAFNHETAERYRQEELRSRDIQRSRPG